jgi:hypothetical protein
MTKQLEKADKSVQDAAFHDPDQVNYVIGGPCWT